MFILPATIGAIIGGFVGYYYKDWMLKKEQQNVEFEEFMKWKKEQNKKK